MAKMETGQRSPPLLTAAEQLKVWHDDPIQAVRDLFGVEPDDWQADVLNAFKTENRICMKASKGPGKTAVLAWLCWIFMLTRPQVRILATSISKDNLADNLWTEMAKWQNESPLLLAKFTWTKTRIFSKDHEETWFMSARPWSRSADSVHQGQTLAGFHPEYGMVVLDEAGGIPDAVAATAEAALATGIEIKLVIAGNPTHLEGPIYRACTTEADLWYVKEITGDPDDPGRSPRVSVEWAREQIKKYGKDNPWVLVNVFGRFPPTQMNQLLGPDEVQAAMDRKIATSAYASMQKRIGVDCARYGDDENVIFPRQGRAAFVPTVMRNAATHELAARVIDAKLHWKSEQEFVDGTGGWGAGTIDCLIVAGHTPIEVQFAGKPIEETFYNKRSEMWWLMCDWVKTGGCLPNDAQLKKELCAPTYWLDKGKLRLEEKEQIKERLGFSPDKADALACTFALPDCFSTKGPGGPEEPQKVLIEE